MSALYLIVGLVAAQRLGEAIYAHYNTRRLLEGGATEAGRHHYPLFVVLHAGWLAAILATVDPAQPPHLALLAFYGFLQLLRGWVLWSLGRYWTTRVIVVPGALLVRRGPYRLVRHPNYMIVCAEVATLSLIFDAWEIALIFSLLNVALLAHRIRVEDRALADKRAAPASSERLQ